MLQYAQSAQQKYEVYIEKNKSEKEQNKKSKQTEIIDQETKVELRQQDDKTIKLLEQEFVTCVDSGGKENDMSLVSKGMATKGKSPEKRK